MQEFSKIACTVIKKTKKGERRGKEWWDDELRRLKRKVLPARREYQGDRRRVSEKILKIKSYEKKKVMRTTI